MTLQDYLQQHYSPSTAKAYQREIRIYTGHYPDAAGAGYKDMVQYIGALRQRYPKAATLHRIVSSIKVYYDWLCHEQIRSDNPSRAIRLRDKTNRDIQLQDLFTPAELERLLNRPERYQHLDARNKVMMSLLIYQGLLPGELEAVMLADIKLEPGTVYIKASPKSNARELSLKPSQVMLFYQYINETRPQLFKTDSSPPVAFLLGLRGEPMRSADITKHVQRSYRGLYPGRPVTARTIRQSVIANLFKAGHDISLVQAFAGHKYPDTSSRYRQTEVATLQAAVNKYHPFL